MEPLTAARSSLVAQLEDAIRHVDILSPAMEPALLDRDEVAQQLIRLARRGRQSRIRVLINDFEPAQLEAHRLLRLTRRLPTAFSLKVLREHPEWNGETIVLTDRSKGLMVIPRDRRVQVIDSRPDAQRWAEQFDRLWLAGDDSPELRQFS